MARWRADGWSRAGHNLKNQDLWELLRRVFSEYQALGYVVEVKRVPAHVGIVGNERADRLSASEESPSKQCLVSGREDRKTSRKLGGDTSS